jgi:hypothetical protein
MSTTTIEIRWHARQRLVGFEALLIVIVNYSFLSTDRDWFGSRWMFNTLYVIYDLLSTTRRNRVDGNRSYQYCDLGKQRHLTVQNLWGQKFAAQETLDATLLFESKFETQKLGRKIRDTKSAAQNPRCRIWGAKYTARNLWNEACGTTGFTTWNVPGTALVLWCCEWCDARWKTRFNWRDQVLDWGFENLNWRLRGVRHWPEQTKFYVYNKKFQTVVVSSTISTALSDWQNGTTENTCCIA